MTPAEVLDDASSRFMVLYYNQPENLERLLRQALGKFQDKAGFILEKWQEESVFALPEHFHAVDNCCDSKRRYCAHSFGVDDNGDKIIILETDYRHEPPFCLYYFCDLRRWPQDEPLPGDCAPLIADYLEALIALQNARMERASMLDNDLRDAVQTMPMESELRQRVMELEMAMEDNKAFVMPAAMF